MRWYWWALTIIVVIAIIIGIWYLLSFKPATNYLNNSLLEMGKLTNENTSQEVMDLTLQLCEGSKNKLTAALISTAGFGFYQSKIGLLKLNDNELEPYKTERDSFLKEICNCYNSKGFSFIDLINYSNLEDMRNNCK